MKLYKVPEGSKIRVTEDTPGPPGEPIYKKGTELKFGHIDGMYSVCFDDNGNRVYLPGYSEVVCI